LRAAAHERAIDATPAPFGQRRATPKGSEVGAAREPHPPGRDDEAIRLSDENREAGGISGELLLEGGWVPTFAAVAPGRSLELADPLEINPVADRPQYDARGSGSAVRQRSGLGDHDRLEFLRDEPGSSQPLLEKGRTVVAVELPLERFISFGEPGDLRVDQPVELCLAQIPEIAVLDPPVITEPEGADEWTLALDRHPDGKGVRYVRPQLRVVEVEECVRLSYHVTLNLRLATRQPTAPGCPRPPLSFLRGCAGSVRGVRVFSDGGGTCSVIDVQRVDFIRVPVTDMEKANHFYGEVLGLEKNPNSPAEDWVEYETGNVTLAVMTPHTHDDEFTPLPPGTIALRVPDVAEAKAKLEAAGVQVNEMWDSGVCHGAGFRDPAGNAILIHHRYAPYGPR
jgi:catechol 2,3-dioxygenase-like lactoylglutathione lyase family enzyme